MAAREQPLQVDYEGLDGVINQLNQMNEQANDIRDMLQRHTEECKGGKWKGKGATGYYEEYEQLILPAVQRLIQGTEEAGSTIKKMQGETRTLEEELQASWKELINLIPGA